MESEHLSPDEVEEYLARIHYTGPIEPTVQALSELQRCHILSVPFENLTCVWKGEDCSLQRLLFDKIVRRHRGGFCFELNTVFSFLLDYFGFNQKTHAAMVFSPITGRIGPPFDHMILAISIEDGLWLSDVGFGDAFLTPLRFSDFPDPQEQESGIYRLRKDGDEFVTKGKGNLLHRP